MNLPYPNVVTSLPTSLHPGAIVGGGGVFGNEDKGASGCRMSYKNSGIIGTGKKVEKKEILHCHRLITQSISRAGT